VADSTPHNEGATVVITNRVSTGKRREYEAWLEEIAPLCKASPGHLDWNIVRPIPGLTETYTVIIRFDTSEHLRAWIDSPVRERLIKKLQPLLAAADDFYISSGLDFWFTPSGAKAGVPVRWKQFLLTWSAIYPLAFAVPLIVLPALQRIGIPAWPPIAALTVTGVVVFLMVYIVMPRYTRLVQRWLFK
jgi:antibiotic biosynthesis monooxygenase (ABM) superfamily enzyme